MVIRFSRALSLSVVLVLVLAACGGGGAGSGSGSGDGESGGGAITGSNTTGRDIGSGTVSCATAFSPERAATDTANGTAECKPLAGTVCPVADGTNLLQRTPIACDDVEYKEYDLTAAGLSSSYYVLNNKAATDYDAVYLGLHYLLADKGAFTNIVRFQELAKGRKVLVIVPQAPTLSRWPTGTSLDSAQVQPTVEWLKSVVSEARRTYGVADTVPLYVAGLSNGAVMSYLFACADPNVSAVLAVSSDANPDTFASLCTADHPLGSVIVHGTADTTTPYGGLPLSLTLPIPEIHQTFNTIDGCTSADATATMADYSDAYTVTISYTPANTCAFRNFLVTIDNAGHNWPGLAHGPTLGNLLFGAHTANFDATLQGYDLLRLAAGN